MKKLLIVTYIDFWRGGAGHASRLTSIVNYLKDKVDLTVLFIGKYREKDDEILSGQFQSITVHFLEKYRELDINSYVKKFAQYMSGKFFDIALLEYIEMYYLLDYIPDNTIKILDTHDLMSEKIISFKQYNLVYSGMRLDFDMEMEMFEAFDYIILINKLDHQKVSKKLSQGKLLLIPHPSNLAKKQIRQTVSVISFIASEYAPNVDAIEYFLNEIWPSFLKYNLTLNIYGRVVEKIKRRNFSLMNVNLIGFVENLEDAYLKSDIIINPVRAGAGLKIKNVEALGNGLPLITTSHGISGIEDARSSALLVADDASEFIFSLERLIDDFSLRESLSRNAYSYAKKILSEDICFAPLLSLLK